MRNGGIDVAGMIGDMAATTDDLKAIEIELFGKKGIITMTADNQSVPRLGRREWASTKARPSHFLCNKGFHGTHEYQ